MSPQLPNIAGGQPPQQPAHFGVIIAGASGLGNPAVTSNIGTGLIVSHGGNPMSCFKGLQAVQTACRNVEQRAIGAPCQLAWQASFPDCHRMTL